MKKFILREDEINYIKNLYGLNEQTNTGTTQTNTGSTQTKNYTIKELQDLILTIYPAGLNKYGADGKYGKETANAIIKILNEPEVKRATPQQDTTPTDTTKPVVAPQQITPKPAAQIPTSTPERQLR